MTYETTQQPEQRQQELGSISQSHDALGQAQMQQAMAQAVICPQCGASNPVGTTFCEQCGALLRMGTCPFCGSEIDADADFCEVCHRYIRPDICSFCGSQIAEQDAFCPECGSPRGGIVCPTCHTLNDFAFCKQCGTPLTDDARQLSMKVRSQKEYQELIAIAHEYKELTMQTPLATDKETKREKECMELRERVLRLLAQDEGDTNPVIEAPKKQQLSKKELEKQKEEKLAQITELLDRMATPPMPSPAKVRNYAMAQKPSGVRLAWVCNWKHAMHSSPCGCAKPQLGGKWIVLGRNSNANIQDDK